MEGPENGREAFSDQTLVTDESLPYNVPILGHSFSDAPSQKNSFGSSLGYYYLP